MSDFTPEDLVKAYRILKAQVAEIETRHKQELAKPKATMEKILGHIDQFLADNNLVNIRTNAGTAYWKTTWSASLDDPDLFMEFVKDSTRWELLDRKGNVTAIREYAKQEGKLPPGAKVEARRKVHIVKAGAAIPEDE